jgi:hypothetical protein
METTMTPLGPDNWEPNIRATIGTVSDPCFYVDGPGQAHGTYGIPREVVLSAGDLLDWRYGKEGLVRLLVRRDDEVVYDGPAPKLSDRPDPGLVFTTATPDEP